MTLKTFSIEKNFTCDAEECQTPLKNAEDQKNCDLMKSMQRFLTYCFEKSAAGIWVRKRGSQTAAKSIFPTWFTINWKSNQCRVCTTWEMTEVTFYVI